jgi:thioredoxin-like negative regulator of GroEL
MSPSRRRWLLGAPAVVALVGGAALVAYLRFGPAADRTDWYPAAAAEAAAAADDAPDAVTATDANRTAAVCYARMNQLHPNDPATLYALAHSYAATGQSDAARGLLLRLAPPGQPGYPDAHLRLARMDLSSDRPSPAAMDDAGRHLGPVLHDRPDDPQLTFWLAVLAADHGQWDVVPAAAAKAGPTVDLLAARLVKIATAQGNAEQAEKWSRYAAKR